MIANVPAVIVIVSSIVQLGYCFYFFFRLYGKKADAVQEMISRDKQTERYPEIDVSVIVCARNEAINLTGNLPLVLNQRYHNATGKRCFEVIVVNDGSIDDTAIVLGEMAKRNAHLKIVTINADDERTLPGKKFALSKGVAVAAHDHVVMLDADCAPASAAWLLWMAQPLTRQKSIVAGYGGYTTAHGLLNLFIRAETVHTFLQYHTYNLAGLPYMAVGRNLACKKELLEYAQSQPVWQATASGDDDLLINLTATADNMIVNTGPLSFTYSEAKHNWKDWMQQKQRHFSTGKLYKKRIQALLSFYAFSHAGCWCGLIITALFWHGLALQKWAVFFFLLRSLVLWMQLGAAAYTTNERRLGFFWPFFDIGWLFYNTIFAPFIFWKNKQQWK